MAVVFRGTEKTRVKDILTVIQIRSSKLSLEKIEGCNLELATAVQDKKIRVHKGFKDAYHSVRKTVWQLVYATTGWSEEWKVCATGHSLGGALAALCAFDYANTRDENTNGPKVFMMNFGCPRIGNSTFQKLYQKTVEHSCRVAIGDDIICNVPPQFNHVGSELLFEKPDEVSWRGKSIKKIEVDLPEELTDTSDAAKEKWQSGVKSVMTINRCKLLVERWSGKRAIVDLPRLRRVFGCSANGRRIRKELVASRKRGRGCCFMQLVSKVIDIKEIQNKKEKIEQKAFLLFQYVKDHTEQSYRRFLKMYIYGNPNEYGNPGISSQSQYL